MSVKYPTYSLTPYLSTNHFTFPSLADKNQISYETVCGKGQ